MVMPSARNPLDRIGARRAGGVPEYFVWLVYFHPYESTDDAFVDARRVSPLPARVSGYIADDARER